MDNSTIFIIANNTFLIGWLCLVFSVLLEGYSRTSYVLSQIGGKLIPLLLFACFLVGFIVTRDIEPKGDIFTLEGIVAIFSAEERLLNIWIELLALMLVATYWILNDAKQRGFNKLFRLAVLFVSFISAGFAYLFYFMGLGLREVAQKVSVKRL